MNEMGNERNEIIKIARLVILRIVSAHYSKLF